MMGKVWWIVGATAVGKKHFIRSARGSEAAREVGIPRDAVPTWISDDVGPWSELVARASDGRDLLVRWQFGREAAIRSIASARPEVRQSIVLIVASASVNADRVVAREGYARWSTEELAAEAEAVAAITRGIGAELGIDVHVLSSDGGTYKRKGPR